jgi:hypothetical protein
LGRLSEWIRAGSEQVPGQRGRGLRCLLVDWILRKWLPVTAPFRIRASPMDLEVRVWLLAIQYTAGTLCSSRARHWPVLCLLCKMRLRLGRVKIGLAFLEMFNLARRVLCADEAAVLTPDFVALGRSLGVLKLCERTTDVRVGVAAHGDDQVWRQSSYLHRRSASWPATWSHLETEARCSG